MQNSLFTSESVCAGHPDKICDQISDAILDEALWQDPDSRVAVETLATTNLVVLAGEVTTKAKLDYEQIARGQIKRLGYDNPDYGFSHQSEIKVAIHQQSNEISQGVDQNGAGDQGMMFGYACLETPELMPLPIALAHRLAENLDLLKEKKLPYLRPDGKTQVTVRYEQNKPIEVSQLVLAVPHEEKISTGRVRADLIEQLVTPVLADYGLSIESKQIVLNGTGVWHQGGPAADTGVTGRKIVVDTYGGMSRVGGGCFSGKDATKVDRSGAYVARFIAKNIVAAGLATRAEVSLAYCIGKSQPVMKMIDTFGTALADQKEIDEFVGQLIETSVLGIIKQLDLKKPVFLKTAAYGHFGREGFSWEEIFTSLVPQTG